MEQLNKVQILDQWKECDLSELLGEQDWYGYEDQRWWVFLRDHSGKDGILKNAKPHAMDRGELIRYRGNLFAYLKSLGHNEISHWINMRINGIKHPSDFDERIQMLYLVDDEFVQQWYARYHEVTFKHEDIEKDHKKI